MDYPGGIDALSPHYRGWWLSTPPQDRPALLAKWAERDRVRREIGRMTGEEVAMEMELLRAKWRAEAGS